MGVSAVPDMLEWPSKAGYQFSLGIFVPLKIPVPSFSGIHAHSRFVVFIVLFSQVEFFWRGWEIMDFMVLFPGGSDTLVPAVPPTLPGEAADGKEKQGYGPDDTDCRPQGGADMRGGGCLEGEIVVLRLARGQADPPAVVVDHDGDVIGVFEGRGAPVERRIVEVPFGRGCVPDEPRELAPVRAMPLSLS